MADLYDLIRDGYKRVRLPHWNAHAYLDVSAAGPWGCLYDVLAGLGVGQPVPIALAQAADYTNWEPSSSADRSVPSSDPKSRAGKKNNDG